MDVSGLKGWRTVKTLKRYGHVTEDEVFRRLEQAMEPKGLADEIRMVVIGGEEHLAGSICDEALASDDLFEQVREQGSNQAMELGKVAAKRLEEWEAVVGDLFGKSSITGYERLIQFGKGLAAECDDLHAFWQKFLEYLERSGEEMPVQCGVVAGLLAGISERDRLSSESILDGVLESPLLRRFLVELQVSMPLEGRGFERLQELLDYEDVPMGQFGSLAWHNLLKTYDEALVRSLMEKVLEKPGGGGIVLWGFHLSFHEEDAAPNVEFRRLGLRSVEVLLGENSSFGDDVRSYYMAQVLDVCLIEAGGLSDEIDRIISAFAECVQRDGNAGGLWRLAAVLAKKETIRFLDEMLDGDVLGDMQRWRLFKDQVEGDGCYNILSGVSAERLLSWCGDDAEESQFQRRLLLLSEAVLPFEKKGSDDKQVVLSEQARVLVEKCVDLDLVIRNLSSRIQPSAWSGDLSRILVERGKVFEELLEHERADVREAAKERIKKIEEWVSKEKRWEEERWRGMQRFE